MHSLTHYLICSPTHAVDRSGLGKASCCCYIFQSKRQGRFFFSGSLWDNLHIYIRKGWLPPGVASESPPKKRIMHFQGQSLQEALEARRRLGRLPRYQGLSRVWPPRRQGGPGIPPPKYAGEGTSRPLHLVWGKKATEAPKAAMGGPSGCGVQPQRRRYPAGRRRGCCGQARAGTRGCSDPVDPPRGLGEIPGRPWRPSGAHLAADRWMSL